MNKRLKLYISVALAMILAVAMSACAQKTETGEIQGKLTQALEDSIVVESGGDATEFKTDAGTVYYLGATDHLTINDVVSVKYHKQGNKYFADVVTLKILRNGQRHPRQFRYCDGHQPHG